MKKSFRINPENRDSVMPRLAETIRGSEKPLCVDCYDDEPKRSSQQNRRLHKIISLCSHESGYSIEEMKLTFKAELLHPIEIVKVRGFRIPVYKSTAAMTVKELNKFMEETENLAALWYSVILPPETY